MWFYPPYDERVRTHVIQRMFAALELCYPWGHRLHKIFNRHTINASYKTLANMSEQIVIHNSIIIKKYNDTQKTPPPSAPCPISAGSSSAATTAPGSPGHTKNVSAVRLRHSSDTRHPGSGSGQGQFHWTPSQCTIIKKVYLDSWYIVKLITLRGIRDEDQRISQSTLGCKVVNLVSQVNINESTSKQTRSGGICCLS